MICTYFAHPLAEQIPFFTIVFERSLFVFNLQQVIFNIIADYNCALFLF